ncbi:MAG TPA: ATP-binding protein [Pyrinomonadaceae bacterium]|jgi:nitrogen fixation/metabolism regulation signal transduction histidine kinase|nr:ATP-binding protein [Pyrinomonadaceae bacterium]
MSRNRFHLGLTMLSGLFMLAVLFVVLLYALTPETPISRGPILLASFIAILLGSLLGILFLLRWLLRPYQKLVGEAERASVETQSLKSKDEAEFVLETFQSVVAQLQEQRQELERLSLQARERASSAEKFSERIVASLPSGLIAFDGTGLSMAINQPGRALLELDGKAIGESYDKLLSRYQELSKLVGDCLQKGTLYRREELETVTADGQIRRLGATIAPIELPPDGGRHGALCLLTDITEVTELREQVALKNKLESLGEMSAGLAHEFKNAVAALQGYVQLLQSLDLNERAEAAAASLLNEVRGLSVMVTAFLNFARPQPLQLEEISITELLEDCLSELQPLFQELSVQVVRNTAENVVVPADERMLRQAILNLIRNAAEAVGDDQNHRQVYVQHLVEREKGKVWSTISIRDTGPGIPASDLQRVFIPFFTTKSKGHGVGLALAHRVITEHSGTLTASNSEHGGAVFTIRLPMGASDLA